MRSKVADDQKIKSLTEKIEKLERFEGIDVDYLLTENMEKDRIIEEYRKEEVRRKAYDKAKASI